MNLKQLIAKANEEIKKKPENAINIVQSSRTGNGSASRRTCEAVVTAICQEMEKRSISETETVLGIAILLQKGGTSPKQPDSNSVQFKTGKLTLQTIRKHCINNNISTRQLARGICQEIAELLIAVGEEAPEGNLAKNYKMEMGKITWEEAIWASDFQTYNPKCPERVKNWLRKDYKEKFFK